MILISHKSYNLIHQSINKIIYKNLHDNSMILYKNTVPCLDVA